MISPMPSMLFSWKVTWNARSVFLDLDAFHCFTAKRFRAYFFWPSVWNGFTVRSSRKSRIKRKIRPQKAATVLTVEVKHDQLFGSLFLATVPSEDGLHGLRDTDSDYCVEFFETRAGLYLVYDMTRHAKRSWKFHYADHLGCFDVNGNS